MRAPASCECLQVAAEDVVRLLATLDRPHKHFNHQERDDASKDPQTNLQRTAMVAYLILFKLALIDDRLGRRANIHRGIF